MGDWLQDRCNSIQKAQQEHIQKSFGEDIEKARAGVYKPTKQNFKEGKAGQKYGSEKKDEDVKVDIMSSSRLTKQFDDLRRELKEKEDAVKELSTKFTNQLDSLKNIIKKYKPTKFDIDNTFLDKFMTDDKKFVLRIYLKTGMDLSDKRSKELEKDLRDNKIPFSIGSLNKGDINLVYYNE